MARSAPNRPSDVPPIDATVRSERLCHDQCYPSGAKALKKVGSEVSLEEIGPRTSADNVIVGRCDIAAVALKRNVDSNAQNG